MEDDFFLWGRIIWLSGRTVRGSGSTQSIKGRNYRKFTAGDGGGGNDYKDVTGDKVNFIVT